MSRLRLIAISMSVLIHMSVGYIMLPLLLRTHEDALNLGHGIDIVLVEQGIATGVVKLGDAMQTIETAEILPVQEPAQPDEVKPEELHDVIASDASTVEEAVVETQEAPAPPTPDAVQVKEQQRQQNAMSAEQSSGETKMGGDAKALGLYLGRINELVERAKVSAPSRRSGTVVMRYTIGLDGKLLIRKVVSSSGVKVLDDAAVAALDRAAPFPPIPPNVSLTPLALTQQFRFMAMLVGGRGRPPHSRRD